MSLRIERTEPKTEIEVENTNEDEQIKKQKIKKTTFRDKFTTCINLITLEPALAAYIFGSELFGTASENLIFEMTCRVNLQHNDTICSNFTLGYPETNKKEVELKGSFDIASKVIASILILCYSSFSDRYKIRKPFFLLPIFGDILSFIVIFFCIMFIGHWPVQIYFVFANLLPLIFGGFQTLNMAMLSYIADISTVEERTSRIGIVDLISTVFAPIAPALGGILFLYISYYGVFSITIVLYLFALLYGIYYIPEKKVKRTKNLCIDIFSIKTIVIDMVKILIRKRNGYRRCLLLLTYICYSMIVGTEEGFSLLIKPYLELKYLLTPSVYSYLRSYVVCLKISGLFLTIVIFVKKLKTSDFMLIIISMCFKIISFLWYAFGNSLVMVYISSLTALFTGMHLMALQSLVSKLVSETEIAKALSLFPIFGLFALIFIKIYQDLWKNTAKTFPEAFLYLSAVVTVPPLILALIMNVIYNHIIEEEKTAEETTNEESNERQQQGIYNEGNDIDVTKL